MRKTQVAAGTAVRVGSLTLGAVIHAQALRPRRPGAAQTRALAIVDEAWARVWAMSPKRRADALLYRTAALYAEQCGIEFAFPAGADLPAPLASCAYCPVTVPARMLRTDDNCSLPACPACASWRKRHPD